MKKNIFPFIPDTNLAADVNCLLQFLRQALPLNKFFKKFPSDSLNKTLGALKFESANCGNTEYFIIKFKDTNEASRVEHSREELSSLGITATDKTRLIQSLTASQKNFPMLNLKDHLSKFINNNNNKNSHSKINEIINITKNSALTHPDNKDKQAEINIFFNFLKEILAKEISEPTTLSADFLLNYVAYLTNLASNKKSNFSDKRLSWSNKYNEIYTLFFIFLEGLTSRDNASTLPSSLSANQTLDYASYLTTWCISESKNSVIGPQVRFSKKYDEISDLINKLFLSEDTFSLAEKLNSFHLHYQQKLINIDIDNSSVLVTNKVIDVIENFQINAQNSIKEFRKNSDLNLEQLNIIYKILNKLAMLMPRFIIPKNTRIGFFQQYTPQNKVLVKLEKTIQPIHLNP